MKEQPRGVDGAAGTILAASRDEHQAVVEFDCDGCGTRSEQLRYVYNRGTSPLHFCGECSRDGTVNRVRAAARIADRRAYVAAHYPDDRPAAIAERLGVSESTIHADVDALEQEGVLEKAPQWPEREPRVCALDGCNEAVTHYGRGGYCSAEHGYAARRQRARVTVTCRQCGRDRELPRHEARKHPDFCGNSCSMRYRWMRIDDDLRGLAESMHERGKLVGRRAQRVLGRLGSRKPPAPGGRQRGRPAAMATPSQAAEIRKLAGRGWGRRAIASKLMLSERLVRNVLNT